MGFAYFKVGSVSLDPLISTRPVYDLTRPK